MAGASLPTVRPPAVAGTFYPADDGACVDAAESYLQGHPASDAPAGTRPWTGAIVPHAGWVCSGAIAGRAIAALARSGPAPDVVVVFGAVHTPVEIDFAAFDSHDAWRVPGGETRLAQDVIESLVGRAGNGLFEIQERLHRHEHAVEVELPLIRAAWPHAVLLPVEVPAIDGAVSIGRRVAEELATSGRRVVYLASSDLTHYGPSYDFTPAGVGVGALEWAKANDRRLLARATDLAAEQIVAEAREHANACGAGAIAAMLAACRDVCGATQGRVLRHANSYETIGKSAGHRPLDAVGYAAAVIG